ncbi:nucleotidyltransferase family protein, partial [Gelidibacter pelagius]
MTKNSIYTTMQLIAEILTFNDNHTALSKQLEQTSVDWNKVVIVASNHLMLPALYCRLKAKGLLKLIPDDLNDYLKEITDINRGRNEVLLAEANEISEIFKKENIDHVFIKGIALISGETFEDPAERMLSDIDLLVAKNQLQRAFNILTRHGYTETVTSVIERKNRRHLPRQVSQEKFGAVELHSEILRHKHRYLISSEQVLQNKRIINGIAIPSVEDAIRISILAFQINDKAHLYGYLSFKTIYDCLALQLPSKSILLKHLADEKHSQSFLKMSSIFFKELAPYKSSNYSALIKRYYMFRINHPKLGQIISSTVHTTINIQVRLKLLFY